jgi:hypothetical protein
MACVIVMACGVLTAPRWMGVLSLNRWARLRDSICSTRASLTRSTSAHVSLALVIVHSVSPSCANSRVACVMRALVIFNSPVKTADGTW